MTTKTQNILTIAGLLVVALIAAVIYGMQQSEEDTAISYCHSAWASHQGHDYFVGPISTVEGYGTSEFYQFMEACKVYYHETK